MQSAAEGGADMEKPPGRWSLIRVKSHKQCCPRDTDSGSSHLLESCGTRAPRLADLKTDKNRKHGV